MFADSRARCPPTSNTSRCIAGHVYPYLCSAECWDNQLLLYWLRYERNKISQNGIDKKPRIPAFYQYHSGCVFYYRRIARKAEAGRDGSPRSINKSAMCPAMWRLTFSGGGRSVRLSANGCQPHRPNTALIFCAAGYHPGLLRTFREHDLNSYPSTRNTSWVCFPCWRVWEWVSKKMSTWLPLTPPPRSSAV